MNGKPKKGLKPDGKKIKLLRTNKFWTISQLANKATCSEKTIENAERGKTLSLLTITLIANALGEDPKSLLANNGARKYEKIQIPFRIVIEGTLGDYLATGKLEQILNAVKTIAGATNDLIVKKMEQGSVVIEVKIAIEDAKKIMEAFVKGDLAQLGIDQMQFFDMVELRAVYDQIQGRHASQFKPGIYDDVRRRHQRFKKKAKRKPRRTVD